MTNASGKVSGRDSGNATEEFLRLHDGGLKE